MDNETTNSDLKQEDHMNKQARINRLGEITESLRSFSRAERGEVLHHIEEALEDLYCAVHHLEDEL
jgi:signal transduction histidine kinase